MSLVALLILAAVGLFVLTRSAGATGPPPRGPGVHPQVRAAVEVHRRTVEDEARWRHAPVPLVLAVIARESRGDVAGPDGAAGEIGLMQVSKTAWQDYVTATADPEAQPFPDALRDPRINIRVGSWYLSERIEDAGGNRYEGLRAYNCGPTGARESPQCGAAYARWVLDIGLPTFAGVA